MEIASKKKKKKKKRAWKVRNTDISFTRFPSIQENIKTREIIDGPKVKSIERGSTSKVNCKNDLRIFTIEDSLRKKRKAYRDTEI